MQAITWAILTETTCGAACWHAREEVCRCSCGGKNHGVLNQPGAEQPARTCKIDGCRYELVAVGKEMHDEASRLLAACPPRGTHGTYTYSWRETERGSPYRVKPATVMQCEKWAELSAYKGLGKYEFYRAYPKLLWKRID